MNRPFHQSLIIYVIWIIGGFLALGTFLDAINIAITFITPLVTYVGTMLILIAWISIQIFLSRHPITWVTKSGYVSVTKLGVKIQLGMVGMVLLLWAPLIIIRDEPNNSNVATNEMSSISSTASINQLAPTEVTTSTTTFISPEQMPIIGGFSFSRSGDLSFIVGDIFEKARVSLRTNFQNPSFNSFEVLTPDTLSKIDIVLLGSSSFISGEWGKVTLSKDEQNALFSFVQMGGCAILFTEQDEWTTANESLIDPFNLDSNGEVPELSAAEVDNPIANSVTSGPFGAVQTFSQHWAGGLTYLGQHASSLANNSVGTALAVIEPGAINVGSGGVVIYTDAGTFGKLFSDSENEILFLNTINFCLAS